MILSGFHSIFFRWIHYLIFFYYIWFECKVRMHKKLGWCYVFVPINLHKNLEWFVLFIFDFPCPIFQLDINLIMMNLYDSGRLGFNRLGLWIRVLLFNFERLDILCSWIGPPSEKLWPFEFLESFRCSISSVSIYYAPESDLRVKRSDHMNF